jgi:hypothetical protein
VPSGHIIHRLIKYKLRVKLIDRVVGKMNESLVEVGGVGLHIGLGGKPGESLLKEVNTQRVGAC